MGALPVGLYVVAIMAIANPKFVLGAGDVVIGA